MKKKIVQVSRGEQPDICSEKGEGLPNEADESADIIWGICIIADIGREHRELLFAIGYTF